MGMLLLAILYIGLLSFVLICPVRKKGRKKHICFLEVELVCFGAQTCGLDPLLFLPPITV